MNEVKAKFSNGKTWIVGVSFYSGDIPEEIVITGIRMNLEGEAKIDDTWELIEVNSRPVEMTSDGAIIPKGESK